MSVPQAALQQACTAYLGIDVSQLVGKSFDELKAYILQKATSAGITAAGNALGDALKSACSGSGGSGDGTAAPSGGGADNSSTPSSAAGDPGTTDTSATDPNSGAGTDLGTPNSADTSNYVGDPSSV